MHFPCFHFSRANIYFYVFANDVRKMSGKVPAQKKFQHKKTEYDETQEENA